MWTQDSLAIEALACGVPVVAYERGGPAEIVRSGETGFVVAADDVAALTHAIGQVGTIRRSRCRCHAEEFYSLEAMGDRVEAWFEKILKNAA